MIIQCGRCSRKFKIDDSRIKPGGSNVRCSKCGHIFIVKTAEGTSGRDPVTDNTDFETPNIQTNPVENIVDSGIDGSAKSESADLAQGTTDLPTGEPQEFKINVPDEGILNEGGLGVSTESADPDQDTIERPTEEPQELESNVPDEEMLDIEIDKSSKDTGNWEEFVSISKTVNQAEDKDTEERSENDKEQKDFNWEKINIEEESEDSEPGIPEMFEEEETMSAEEPEEGMASQDKSEPPHESEPQRRSSEKITLNTDSPEKQMEVAGDFGPPIESTAYERSSVYRTQRKSKRSGVGKIANALMIAAVFAVIVTASLVILINLKLIPEENVTRAKTLIESFLPIKLTQEKSRDIVIMQHSGNWINTRYGPLYVISGMIKNMSDRPIHYIQIKSEFTSAGQTLYEDTIYAGNTFSENELKVSKIEDIVFKLKKKNGDIDYYNMKKLSGLNYDVQPGQSIPFYAVFPSDSTVLGLKYDLQVVNYEDSSIN